jgi:hypothetical protein
VQCQRHFQVFETSKLEQQNRKSEVPLTSHITWYFCVSNDMLTTFVPNWTNPVVINYTNECFAFIIIIIGRLSCCEHGAVFGRLSCWEHGAVFGRLSCCEHGAMFADFSLFKNNCLPILRLLYSKKHVIMNWFGRRKKTKKTAESVFRGAALRLVFLSLVFIIR